MKKIAKLLLAIIVCQFAGIIGSIFTFEAIPNWYATLQKPAFSPPNWLFGPVWITLYALMGISLFFVLEENKNKQAKTAIAIFAVQLMLNALWSMLFFGLRAPLLGLVGIIALWLAIAATIIKFYPISKKAAWLLVPYLAWVSVATTLNLFIVLLNP